jgi:uncharacterized phage protein gp47/JayE
MALPTVGTITYPTAAEIRDGILRTIKLGCARAATPITVNVLVGSEPYIKAEALARRLVVAFAHNQIQFENFSPLTATGDNLTQIAAVFGVTRRSPSKATGFVTISCTGTPTIPAGYRAVAPNGETYDTISVAIVSNGGTVEVQAVNTGTATNQAYLTKLTWTSSSVGALNATCTVAVGGIDGGAPEDDDETLRRRLVERLANPAVGGNNADVRRIAEDASAAVEAAYVFAALRGPASLDVAITKAEGDRTLSSATVSLVDAALRAALPGHVDINTTSVTAQEVDVVFRATLPAPTTSGGAGGGWLDATSWPQGTPAAGTNDGKVTAYAAPTATVRTTTTPVIGQHIGVWDPVAEVMHQYTITAVGGVSGAYTITVQGLEGAAGFKTSPLNAYISAGCVSLALYAAKMLKEAQALGPGEKTASLDLLPRARRYPNVDHKNPTDLDLRITGNIQAAYPEIVFSGSGSLSVDTGTTTASTSPDVPATTTDPPNILVLKYFAIWKA